MPREFEGQPAGADLTQPGSAPETNTDKSGEWAKWLKEIGERYAVARPPEDTPQLSERPDYAALEMPPKPDTTAFLDEWGEPPWDREVRARWDALNQSVDDWYERHDTQIRAANWWKWGEAEWRAYYWERLTASQKDDYKPDHEYEVVLVDYAGWYLTNPDADEDRRLSYVSSNYSGFCYGQQQGMW